ncbi:MAG: hypothetical protein B6V02_03430 [Thermoprotei archaeon ex4572_64]|nr:MAG: hypothetical protein B6V02_03430 [Thermoprotei archaeon ex4572_64]
MEPELDINMRLQKSGTLVIINYCNLHGLWKGRKEIQVIE